MHISLTTQIQNYPASGSCLKPQHIFGSLTHLFVHLWKPYLIKMVLTGVEIVGIVLAVVPLCITVLEHHQDEIRPFKMLFRYKTQAQKARQQFGVVHSRFRQVIELVIRDLALSQRQLNMMLSSLHGTVDACVWSSDEVEQALIDHFGTRDYRTGFLPLVQTILANIKDISDILSLDLTCASNSAQVRRHRTWKIVSDPGD